MEEQEKKLLEVITAHEGALERYVAAELALGAAVYAPFIDAVNAGQQDAIDGVHDGLIDQARNVETQMTALADLLAQRAKPEDLRSLARTIVGQASAISLMLDVLPLEKMFAAPEDGR